MLRVAFVCTPCCMLLRKVWNRSNFSVAYHVGVFRGTVFLGGMKNELFYKRLRGRLTFQPTTPNISFVPWSPKRSATIGPFIREKISRGLHKTRTPRINGTKSTFTAYSTHGQLKPRLILAEEFWVGLIQAAAYLGCESVSINALERCPRFAEAVNDCCACSVFNYIPDLFGRETRTAVAGKWSAAPESRKCRLNSTSSIAGISLSNHSIDRWQTFCRGFRTRFAIAQHLSWPKY